MYIGFVHEIMAFTGQLQCQVLMHENAAADDDDAADDDADADADADDDDDEQTRSAGEALENRPIPVVTDKIQMCAASSSNPPASNLTQCIAHLPGC